MKELPILFSGPMVRAILDGRKTQTRRAITPQPKGPAKTLSELLEKLESGMQSWSCPYGAPGDRLWVKETFSDIGRPDRPAAYVYKADTLGPGFEESERARKVHGYRWTPSIFMPRGVSRLTLNVLGVRAQRVQEISYEDAVAEGIDHEYPRAVAQFRVLWDSINSKPRPRYATVGGKKVVTHYESFPWDDIQETREYRGKPWLVYGNSWVWAVSFSQHEA